MPEVIGLDIVRKDKKGDIIGLDIVRGGASELSGLPVSPVPFKRPSDVGLETVIKTAGEYATGERPASEIPARIAEAVGRQAPALFAGGEKAEGELPRAPKVVLDALQAAGMVSPLGIVDMATHPKEAVVGLAEATKEAGKAALAPVRPFSDDTRRIASEVAERPFTKSLELATPVAIAAGVKGLIPKKAPVRPKPRIFKDLSDLKQVKSEFPEAPAAPVSPLDAIRIGEKPKEPLPAPPEFAKPPAGIRSIFKEEKPPELVGMEEPRPVTPLQVAKMAEEIKTPEIIRAATEAAAFGEKNALFTRGRRDAALQRIKEKSVQIRSGVDPSILADWLEVGGFYAEGGIREFGAWSQKMIDDLGDDIKPHLRELYEKTLSALPREFVDNAVKETINLERLNIEPAAKARLEKTISDIQPELQKAKGAKVTHEEVIEAAKTSEMLQRATTREATLQREAALLKTRQQLAALAEKPEATAELLKTLEVVKTHAADLGRELGALRIDADPSLSSIKVKVLKRLLDIGKTADELIEASKGVDFNNANQLADFYRKFVKPTLPEIIDEYRYINLLSSPRTHIVNAFSNLLQVGLLRPSARLATGAIDIVGSKLRGVEQEYYIRQVPAYTKGAVNAIPEAGKSALKALRGELFVERPDIARIPTRFKALKPFQFIPRGMEAMDVFFRTLAESGELEALLKKEQIKGRKPTEAELAGLKTKAKLTAEELVFRKKPDPQNLTGQGSLLSTIDEVTNQVYAARRLPMVKWFVPFVQTVANITKQGIEYSPAGPLTIFKSAAKTEQLGKALVGSTVFAGAAALALDGRTTWGVPKNEDEKQAFFDAGMQPYSIKIGDKWYSYSKLGPLAYPIAMAAAVRHYTTDAPSATTDNELKKVAHILGAMAEFFADQSYVEGIGDIWRAIDGRVNFASVIENLATQVIPLSSLQRWVNSFIDPVFRKTEKGFSAEAIAENLQKSIIGLSSNLPPHKTAAGLPALRPSPLLNALSPIQIRPAVPDAVARYQDVKTLIRLKKERDVAIRRMKEEAGQ